MRTRHPRGIRARLLTTNAIVMLLALAVLTVASNAILRRSLDRDASNLVRARAGAGLATLRPKGDGLRVIESPDDSAIDVQIWVFDHTGTIETPTPASKELDRHAQALAGGPSKTVDVEGTRLHSVPVVRKGTRLGTLVAGVGLRPYTQTARTALFASIALAVLLFALVMVASRSILRRALEPVSQMTRAAAEWSEHYPDRRFARGEPYDELSSLAATLDTLLTRLGNSLRNEQRFTSEMSHELRTPLTRIAAEVELALRRERTPDEQRVALAAIGRSASQMARTIDALVAVARFEGAATRGSSDARDAIEHAIESIRPAGGDQLVEPRVDAPRVPIRLGADAEVVERILAPVIENGSRHATSSVTVAVRREGTTAVITVTDDGKGVAAADVERIFQPGVRIAPRAADRTAGLGLALARRLAAAAGGSIQAAPGPGGRFTIRLPLA
ncbi:MAG TPA: HAMP domain-containing sensor histidine kinase [Gaiellales bacterium]|jgi:signal transduction histidine kinase|nr:HAMP domain-containing sensor histidine kinase [Gaiellales bacterium]